MATILKRILSESTDGKQIPITGASSANLTTLHTAVTGVIDIDEIYLYAYNKGDQALQLTIYWGAVTSADEVKVNVPPQSGRYLVTDRKLLRNGLIVKAFCASGSGINIDGYVNRFDY